MALRILSSKKRMVIYVESDEYDDEDVIVLPQELGDIIDKSYITDVDANDRVLKISIPENVKCIEPGTFTDYVNLKDVTIRGDVYGVEWCGGTDNLWTVPLSPSTLVEELKRGTGRILIRRFR